MLVTLLAAFAAVATALEAMVAAGSECAVGFTIRYTGGCTIDLTSTTRMLNDINARVRVRPATRSGV
jgi:hypothetical protein